MSLDHHVAREGRERKEQLPRGDAQPLRPCLINLAVARHVQGVVQCLRKVRGERVVPLRLDRRQPLPSGISKGLGTAKRKPHRSYVNGVHKGAAVCPRHTSPGLVLRPTTSQGSSWV